MSGRLRTVVAALVGAVPFWVAVLRAPATSQWRDDLALLRDVELVGAGAGGAVSTLLTQGLTLLPLGPIPFRAALGSTIALAVAARLVWSLTMRLFEALHAGVPRESPAPVGGGRLGVVLAGVAALGVALAPPWQREATVAGGALVATALALGVLRLSVAIAAPSEGRAPGRAIIGASLLGAGLVAENPLVALVTVASSLTLVLAHLWHKDHRPVLAPRRTVWVGSLAAVVVALLLTLPTVLRPLAPGAVIDLGHAWSPSDLAGSDAASSATSALAAWLSDLGIVTLASAVVGIIVAATRREGRLVVAPLLLLAAADVVWPARGAALMTIDSLMPIRLLALATWSALGAVGVHGLFRALFRMRVPMARAAAVLIVSFQVSMLALASEEAGVVADRSASFGADEWTDVALERLPPASVVLVRDPVLAWRLWSEQRIAGARPDVVVVPIGMLGRGRVAADAVRADPAIEPLIRSYALTGKPGEYELSKLADVRPLHVQLDPDWSNELVSHLVVDGVWLQYAAQPLGPSDRLETAKSSLDPLRRLLATTDPAVGPDPSTTVIAARGLEDQAALLARAGDAKAASIFVERMAQLSHADPDATRTAPLAVLDRELAVLRSER